MHNFYLYITATCFGYFNVSIVTLYTRTERRIFTITRYIILTPASNLISLYANNLFFYCSGVQPDGGYVEVAETCSWDIQINVALCSALLGKYHSENKIKTEMGRACSTHGEGAYRVLVGKPERIRPFGRPTRILEDNIKMYLRIVGWGH